MNRPLATDRRPGSQGRAGPLADFLFDAFFGGAIGGSAVALVFSVTDAMFHEVLYTPSLLGSVLFLGMEPSAATPVRLDMVALFTVVHLVAFGALGLVVAVLLQRLQDLALHPGIVTLVVFAVLEVGVLAADGLVMHGIVAEIGFLWISLANLLTGLAMAVFLLRAHEDLYAVAGEAVATVTAPPRAAEGPEPL